MGIFGKKPQLVNAPYVPPPRRDNPGPSMDQAIHNSEMRTGSIEARIRAIDADIVNFKREMQRSRPGTATFNMYKRRALQAMRQKKSLESRVSMNSNATFNLEQIRDVKYMQQDHVSMVSNLRAANQDLRANQSKIDFDEVEDLQDDLQEAMQDASEVSEMLGRSYDVDNVDEAELEAELNEFEEDTINYAAGDDLSVPSYLQPSSIQSQAVPQAPNPNAVNYAAPTGMPAQRY